MLSEMCSSKLSDSFGTPLQRGPGWFLESGKGERSLGTILPKRILGVRYGPRSPDGEKWGYRLSFVDESDQEYSLAVVDLAFRYMLDFRRQFNRESPEHIAKQLTNKLQKSLVFLRIGLARGWAEDPDRCYVQVTGVYSFPDYLDGRCFADFIVRPGKMNGGASN